MTDAPDTPNGFYPIVWGATLGSDDEIVARVSRTGPTSGVFQIFERGFDEPFYSQDVALAEGATYVPAAPIVQEWMKTAIEQATERIVKRILSSTAHATEAAELSGGEGRWWRIPVTVSRTFYLSYWSDDATSEEEAAAEAAADSELYELFPKTSADDVDAHWSVSTDPAQWPTDPNPR